MLLAFDRKTGKLLWQQVAKVATPHEGYHPTYGSFASNSPVTDGKHVVAFFGSRGVYCYDLDGKKIWEKDFGIQLKMRLTFGEGAWPAIEGSKLLLLFDHEGDSFLVALAVATGKELWRTPSSDGSTKWSGPVVITYQGKKQVVVSATKSSQLRSGDWEADLGGRGAGRKLNSRAGCSRWHRLRDEWLSQPESLGGEAGPREISPAPTRSYGKISAATPTPSPVLHEDKLYVVTDGGMLSCFDAKTGKAFYQQQRLPKPYNFKASPVGVNGKLYLATERAMSSSSKWAKPTSARHEHAGRPDFPQAQRSPTADLSARPAYAVLH
jgi:outer membrane protein assembly factor BamB